MKNKKKILSAITALTITASAFAGMVIPANAEAAMIDFDNTSITATEIGNSTEFAVIDSSSEAAPGLNAVSAGKVLHIGGKENKAAAYLGYTAALGLEGDNVIEYSGATTMKFKLEVAQKRNDGKDATMSLGFADVSKNQLFTMDIGTGANNKFTVSDTTANFTYDDVYDVTATFDFDGGNASVVIEDSIGNEILKKEDIGITGTNLAYMYYPNTDWRYGDIYVDDIIIDAENAGAPVYYTATINTERYAKMTTSDNTIYHADVNGTITIPLIKPNTTFDYTLHKEGYTDVTGTVEVTDNDFTDNKPMTIGEDIIFIESEFGSDSGEYLSPAGSRNDSISLGSYELPTMADITVDLNFEGFGNNAGQQKTWALVTDAGRLAGLQILDDGLYAWTGWTGSSNMNQSSDIGAYTNGVRLGNAPSGNFTVRFVLDTTTKSIVVLYGDTSQSIPYSINATALTGIDNGLYRYNGALATQQIKITEPDPTYIAITGGISELAKISGRTLSYTFDTIQTVIDPNDTLEWTVARDEGDTSDMTGISIAGDEDGKGVLSVTDEAEPGKIKVTVKGSNSNKTASQVVTIYDFSEVTATVDGPNAMEPGKTGQCRVTSLVDSLGADVLEYFDPKFTSEDPNVVQVDSETGAITAVAAGSTNVVVKIGNPGKETEVKIPVNVGIYSKVIEATGNSTEISIADIEENTAIKSYQITTATDDGVLVKQTEVFANSTQKKTASDGVKIVATYDTNGVLTNVSEPVDVAEGTVINTVDSATEKTFYWKSLESMEPTPIKEEEGSADTFTVDTTGATKVEVAPIYAVDLNTNYAIPAGTYNFTITAGGARGDVTANGQLLINNMQQYGSGIDATVEANDVVVNDGYLKISTADDKGINVKSVTVVKAPSIVNRKPKIYVLGDSLVAMYYGDGQPESELRITGWGQVLSDYMTDEYEIVDIANSGADTNNIKADQMGRVELSGMEGDIMLLESGYNDKGHSIGTDVLKANVKEMVDKAKAKNIEPIIVTPNASAHDYNNSVAWASTMIEAAQENGVKLIDLSKLSYDFLYELYGSEFTSNDVRYKYNVYSGVNTTRNSENGLHSTYIAANCWAMKVAEALYGLGYTTAVDTTYEYTFNDGTNDITVKVTPTTTDDTTE